jgi:hypothetical protein
MSSGPVVAMVWEGLVSLVMASAAVLVLVLVVVVSSHCRAPHRLTCVLLRNPQTWKTNLRTP